MTDAVMTVTGAVSKEALGITHSHEHVLWDYWGMFPRNYESIFDDQDVAVSELQQFADAGGGAVVDCTSSGLGPRPQALKHIAERTGVNIILGCGWYREIVYTQEVFEKTSSELAEVLIRQLTYGFDDTDVRAGFIGEIGTERGHITPAEERVFLAAASAARETDSAILTHTTHFGELALEQIDLLESAGVDPAQVVIGHLGDREDTRDLLRIAERGVYLSIDNIGYSGEGYPSDDVRLNSVLTLMEAGYVNRIVLGTDISTRSALRAYGGRGYPWLIEEFVPRLTEAGLSEEDISALVSTNIAQVLVKPGSELSADPRYCPDPTRLDPKTST